MRTLALRGGARVAVVAAEWRDAFGVVTRGRVQLELRDGRPGPVLGRDAGFWLHGTGVRALRNPGRRTARVRIVIPRSPAGRHTPHASYRPWRNDMTSIDDTGAVAGPTPGRTARTDQLLRLVVTGLTATLAAMVVTTSLAGLAKALGVDFAVTNSTEAIPVPGIAVVTGFFSVVGVVIAVALRRWSARPAERFLRTAVSLTAISLVPPVVFGADAATTVALVGLHLVAAAVMIPALVRSLRTRTDRAGI